MSVVAEAGPRGKVWEMITVEQARTRRSADECKPWCSPKHYRFCGGPCCPHLHEPKSSDAHREPARTTG